MRLVWRLARSAVAAYVVFALGGLGIGVAIVATSYSPSRLWLVWEPLALALSAAAGSVFVYGLRRWRDLQELHKTRVRDVVGPVAFIAVVGSLIVLSPDLIHALPRSNLPDGVLVVIAIALAVPAACVMYGVRDAASSTRLAATAGQEVAVLVALRRLLERLLAAVGALVALATLQKGALLALQRTAGPQAGIPPPQYILVFGAFGSLLAALVYVPAWAALRDRGLRLCDVLLSMETLKAVSQILNTAEDRQKLQRILGVDRSILADLQTGLAILAPLIAGAVGAFLPH